MALKAMLFLFTSFLVFTVTVSSKDEELKEVTYVKEPEPAQPPAKDPLYAPPPPVKTPPSQSPPPKAPAYAPPPPVNTPPSQSPPPKAPAPVPPVEPPTSPPLPPVKSKQDCIPRCDQRCQLHNRKRVCMRACMTCCDRCKCVPPGTFVKRLSVDVVANMVDLECDMWLWLLGGDQRETIPSMSFEHQSYFNKISQNMAIQRLASTFVIWLACSILAVSAQHVGTPGLSPVLGTPGLAPVLARYSWPCT
nr:gibberellin-regulated protein 14 [Quercus suber]